MDNLKQDPTHDLALDALQGQQETPEPDKAAKAQLEGAYDKFTERVADILGAGRDGSRKALNAAMESAREKLSAAGEFSAEQGEQFKRYLLRDLEHTQAHAKQLGREAKDRLQPGRLRAGALATLSEWMQSTGEALQSWSRKADEAITYQAGDITSAGTLTCTNCGHVTVLHKTSLITPCPECSGTRYRKTY
jgi:Zinc-ribbon containing domain